MAWLNFLEGMRVQMVSVVRLVCHEWRFSRDWVIKVFLCSWWHGRAWKNSSSLSRFMLELVPAGLAVARIKRDGLYWRVSRGDLRQVFAWWARGMLARSPSMQTLGWWMNLQMP